MSPRRPSTDGSTRVVSLLTGSTNSTASTGQSCWNGQPRKRSTFRWKSFRSQRVRLLSFLDLSMRWRPGESSTVWVEVIRNPSYGQWWKRCACRTRWIGSFFFGFSWPGKRWVPPVLAMASPFRTFAIQWSCMCLGLPSACAFWRSRSILTQLMVYRFSPCSLWSAQPSAPICIYSRGYRSLFTIVDSRASL